jgi:thymidylate kinase
LSRLPRVGNWLESYIEGRASKVRTSLKVSKAPETLPAIVMFAFTLRRLRRFRRMLSLRQEGMIIIADRYPQLDFPRAFDGPDMAVGAQGNRFVQRLAVHEQRAFEWMCSFQPDLVLRLNVDLDTACERKPDHRRESLQRKIEVTPLLTFNGAEITEIDASRPLAEVLSEARAAVAQCLSARGYQSAEPPEARH